MTKNLFKLCYLGIIVIFFLTIIAGCGSNIWVGEYECYQYMSDGTFHILKVDGNGHCQYDPDEHGYYFGAYRIEKDTAKPSESLFYRYNNGSILASYYSPYIPAFTFANNKYEIVDTHIASMRKISCQSFKQYKPQYDDFTVFIAFFHSVADGINVSSYISDCLQIIRQGNVFGLYYRDIGPTKNDTTDSRPPVWCRFYMPKGIKYVVAPNLDNIFIIYRNGATVWLNVGNNVIPYSPAVSEYLDRETANISGNFPDIRKEVVDKIRLLRQATDKNSSVYRRHNCFVMTYHIPENLQLLFKAYLTQTFVEENEALMSRLYSCDYYFEPFDRKDMYIFESLATPFYGDDGAEISKSIYGLTY